MTWKECHKLLIRISDEAYFVAQPGQLHGVIEEIHESRSTEVPAEMRKLGGRCCLLGTDYSLVK
jgi:hypothetical protein